MNMTFSLSSLFKPALFVHYNSLNFKLKMVLVSPSPIGRYKRVYSYYVGKELGHALVAVSWFTFHIIWGRACFYLTPCFLH